MEQFELGNTGLDSTIRTANDANIARFGHLNVIVDAITALQEVPPGSGIESVQAGTGITIDSITDPLNPLISLTDTSAFLPLAGGTMDSGATINFSNSSNLREGTIDQNLGGYKGIAQVCSVGYELKWEAGRLYVMNQGGTEIRESLYNFKNEPGLTDDSKAGYNVGSLWTLDDGTTYVCINNEDNNADWVLQVSNGSGTYTPTITDNIGAVATISGRGFYSVVNGLVTVTLNFSVDYSSSTTGEFYFDLPVPPIIPFEEGDVNSMVSVKTYCTNHRTGLVEGYLASSLIKNVFSSEAIQGQPIDYSISLTYFS